jgi:CO dehydrogenase/acetyl-CoA synthase beta subunit
MDPLTILVGVLGVVRWFRTQNALNGSTIREICELRQYVLRMEDYLSDYVKSHDLEGKLKRRDRNIINFVSELLTHLNDAKRISIKYADGFKYTKFWVLPSTIKAKVNTVKAALKSNLEELHVNITKDVCCPLYNRPGSVVHQVGDRPSPDPIWNVARLRREMSVHPASYLRH